MTGPWRSLEDELDAWAAAGRTADFWWRDDDAVAVTPEFRRLLAVRDRADAPLAIAVIPKPAEPGLARAADGCPDIRFLQHGYAHVNHAAAGEKKCELSARRDPVRLLGDLRAGRTRMTDMFGDRWVNDVMVPPWNRIDSGVAAALPDLGFRRLSAFGRRTPGPVPAGLTSVNAHIDLVDWRGDRGFVGDRAAAAAASAHLAARRASRCDPDEPTGILTHHAVQGEASWDFVIRLAGLVAAHPAARWCVAVQPEDRPAGRDT